MKKISGYEFAQRVQFHHHGGVEALLSLSGNDESCWLELKAGMALRPEDIAKGETEKDLYWNIASAVMEIMNTSGGVLFIGIQDKTHEVVPLRNNDPRHIIENFGLEDYRRKEILERIWPENKTWKTRKYTWSIQDDIPENLIEVREVQYKDESIAAVLIKPAVPCIRVWKNGEVEEIRAREPGEIGKLNELIGSKKMAGYEENYREIETDYFGGLWERFEREANAQSSDAIIDRKIEEYYCKLEEETRKRRLFDLSCFTELDASGEMSDEEDSLDDFMNPDAVEVFENDDWLNGMDDNDDDDDTDDDDDDDEDDNDDEDYDEDDDFDEDCEDDENDDEPVRIQRSGDLLSLMSEISRLILLGEPGGGKTTCLTKFTLSFQHSEDKCLAVFIPMGKWKDGGSIESFLTKYTGLDAGQWSELISKNRLRLVIDAVNECPDQFRKAAVVTIQNFLRDNPSVSAVISARTAEDLKVLEFSTFTVQPMNEERQKTYLTRYLKDEAAAEVLLTGLKTHAGGSEIASNPMLLRLVIEVFKIENELPCGRAALYHKWLDQWYRREYGKAAKSGDPLPWEFEEALHILSDLALESRLRGYRDIPMDVAKEILQKYAPDCIEKLCQGPVVLIDDDFIRFRHETFQEYLCAEAQVQHPEKMPIVPEADLAQQWGMPVAYASELRWPLPNYLWRAAWKLNPWFGAAVTDDSRANAMKEKDYTGPIPAFNSPMIKFKEEDNDWLLFHLYKLQQGKLYSNNIKCLKYIILTRPEIKRRWAHFEIVNIMSNQFDQKIVPFAENHISYSSVEELVPEYINSEELKNAISTKCKSVYMALTIIQLGLATKDEFKDRIPKWIQNATPGQAKQMIQAGLVTKDEFKDRIPKWIQNATLGQAKQMIQAGFATKDEFKDRIPKWIQNATPRQAKQMIQAGLITKDEFKDRIPKWIQNASKKAKKLMIQWGWATVEDFKEQVLNHAAEQKTDSGTIMISKETTMDKPAANSKLATKTLTAQKYLAIAKILQQQDSAKKADSFLKLQPKGISLNYAKFKANPTIKTIIAMAQSLGTKKDQSSFVQENKQKEFEALLRANPWISSLVPGISDGVLSPTVPQSLKTTAVKKTKSPTSHKGPSKRTVIHGVNFDPEINVKQSIQVTNFSKYSKHIRIYIDETWPRTQAEEYSDIGVIGGIVWDGAKYDATILPHIPTHIREQSISVYRNAISIMQSCSKVFPFIFPILKKDVKESDYPELIRIVMITLLGWILPQDGDSCEVEIFFEGIASSGMQPGENIASSIQEICNALALTNAKGRMSRWNITCVKSMPPEQKEFEYIPYADAVSYLAVPTTKAKKYGEIFQASTTWPGYVPLSLDLLRLLTQLDTGSPAGYADTLLEFAKTHSRTKLFSYVMSEAVSRAKSDLEFHYAVFQKLEQLLEQKDRDMRQLESVIDPFIRAFSVPELNQYPNQKLIRILVELQAANHQGEPEKLKSCVEAYENNRNVLLKQNRDLCAYTDMNLAVHYNDRFEFDKAAEICRSWEKDPAFEYLQPENQGRIISSIGQSFSLAGDPLKADQYFDRAVKIFLDKQNPMPKQADHTSVYRAINILDAGAYPVAKQVSELIFGCSFEGAIEKYGKNTNAPFHHHLLVKNLYFNPEIRNLREQYIALREFWETKPQHPWEQITFYRILMQAEVNQEYAKTDFERQCEQFNEMQSGAVLKLIFAFILAGEKLIGHLDVSEKKFEDNVNAALSELPALNGKCAQLRAAFSGKLSVPDFWKILPFNYK